MASPGNTSSTGRPLSPLHHARTTTVKSQKLTASTERQSALVMLVNLEHFLRIEVRKVFSFQARHTDQDHICQVSQSVMDEGMKYITYSVERLPCRH